MNRATRVLVPLLALAGLALIGGFAWVATLQTGYCGRYPPPSGWIDAGLIVLALACSLVVAGLVVGTAPVTRMRWALAAASIAEAGTAIGLVIYISLRFAHAYDCG